MFDSKHKKPYQYNVGDYIMVKNLLTYFSLPSVFRVGSEFVGATSVDDC